MRDPTGRGPAGVDVGADRGAAGADVRGPRVEVLPDAASVADVAADSIVAGLRAALEQRDEAHIALTGGSSAIALYHALGSEPRRDALDWSRVHFWWGDERFVPLDHGESNAGLAMVLLFGVGRDQENASMTFPARAERIHPVPVDPAAMRHEGPDGAARRYADELERTIARRVDGVPAFDVVLLGVGPDGHILSVFPGSPALEPGAPLAMGIDAPQHVEPHVPRVTLSPRILDAATEVIVSVSGAGKTAIVGRVLRGERDPRALPAQLATGSNAVWLLDRESAAGLG